MLVGCFLLGFQKRKRNSTCMKSHGIFLSFLGFLAVGSFTPTPWPASKEACKTDVPCFQSCHLICGSAQTLMVHRCAESWQGWCVVSPVGA